LRPFLCSFSAQERSLALTLPGGARFERPLFAPVAREDAALSATPSKLSLTLRKAEPAQARARHGARMRTRMPPVRTC
jgi:hypothetical protein